MLFWHKQKKGAVFVGLSGGVDSTVSAAVLKKEGYDVTGVFIKIVVPGYPCTAGADRLDAMRVAAHLQIPFIELDLSKEYEEEVFKTSIDGFAHGETPNPDTLCNRQIKFGAFYRFAKAQGANFIATGHYAQTKHNNTSEAEASVELYIGKDPEKDQSYFLWAVPEEALTHTLFPVGGMHKSDVRALAGAFNLPNARRKDSQGLCFLGPISMDEMLKRELSPQTGDVVSETGEVIGQHSGAALYTLGQRHGFELFAHTPDTPVHFVIDKNVACNTITVSSERFPQGASATDIRLRECNWLGLVEPGACWARFRYRQKLIPASVSFDSHTSNKEERAAHITLHVPHYVPTGQSLVLYRGERCLGGGSVDKSSLIFV